MKRLLFGLSLVLLQAICCLTIKAQGIENGSKWWDGIRLYTAQIDEVGDVRMIGESEEWGGDSFKLKKDKLRPGSYLLASDNPSGKLPIRGKVGFRVDYIQSNGTTFLAVRKSSADCVYTLTQTSDDLATCVSQQKAAEERETYWLMQNRLLSITFLGKFSKAQLRLMRNEILARRGWVFQSKDLKEYFGSQSWYHPLGNNYSTKISLLEQTNVQLITNEEILSDKDRVGPVKTDVAQATTKPVQQKPVVDVPKKVEDEPKKVEEATQPVVDVPKKVEEEPKKVEEVTKPVVEVPKTSQGIENGSKWWDGIRLYTAQIDEVGDVRMIGESEEWGGDSFKLKKDKLRPGNYLLASDNSSGKLPIRGKVGFRVDYIQSNGTTFLAVRKSSADCVYTLTQTSDDLATCVSQQKAAEERETYWLMQNRLLSITFLGKFTKAQLRLMRNEILARRGWVFQSKDLKEYFGSQSWYHPLGNNYSTKISLLEQTNVQLITNEEILSDKDRVGPVKTDVAQATTKPVQQKPVVDVPKKVEEEPKKVEDATKPVVDVPKKAEEEPKKVEEATKPVVDVPKKVEEEPKKVEEATQPVVDVPKKVEEESKKVEEATKPVVDVPKKVEEEPKKVEEATKPVVEVPKKAEEEPKKVEEATKPVVDVPKKVEEATKPVVEVPKKAEQTSNRPEPANSQLVFVANEEQFLNALGNNRVVEISANTHLNLSAFLEQENLFSGIAGREWATAATSGGSSPVVVSEKCDDGQQLTLKNFHNLIIRGQKNSSIEVSPRYAVCLNLIDCENCRLENLTIGHTEGGDSEGGVVGIRGGKGNSIVSCDLYGSYGLVVRETNGLSVSRTNIHDCTYGIMELWDSEDLEFDDCDFFHNREFDLISNMDSPNTTFRGCRFYDNWIDVPLFVSNLDINLYNCEIYHPVIGSKQKLLEPNKDCKWSNEEHYVPEPRQNPIGPDANSLK